MTPKGFIVLVLSVGLLLYFTSMYMDMVGDNILAWIMGFGTVVFAWWGLGIKNLNQ